MKQQQIASSDKLSAALSWFLPPGPFLVNSSWGEVIYFITLLPRGMSKVRSGGDAAGGARLEESLQLSFGCFSKCFQCH